jgi:hypothetical protein
MTTDEEMDNTRFKIWEAFLKDHEYGMDEWEGYLCKEIDKQARADERAKCKRVIETEGYDASPEVKKIIDEAEQRGRKEGMVCLDGISTACLEPSELQFCMKHYRKRIEEAEKRGYTQALDDHQILHGEDAKRFIENMGKPNPARDKFLKECKRIRFEIKKASECLGESNDGEGRKSGESSIAHLSSKAEHIKPKPEQPDTCDCRECGGTFRDGTRHKERHKRKVKP